jgi:hypothetical protein
MTSRLNYGMLTSVQPWPRIAKVLLLSTLVRAMIDLTHIRSWGTLLLTKDGWRFLVRRSTSPFGTLMIFRSAAFILLRP